MTQANGRTLRVLCLATLFPDASRPRLAPFLVRQIQELQTFTDVEIKLLAPRGLPPWPLSRLPHYRALKDQPERETWAGIDVLRPVFRHWPGSDGRFDVAAIVKALTPLLQNVREAFPFDIIDAQFFFPDGPAAVQLGRAFGVPVSVKARGADIHYWGKRPKPGKQVRNAGQQADGILAVSAALRNDMIGLGMPGYKIGIHYTGVDLEVFRPQNKHAIRRALGIAGPLIVSVGALIPRKRQQLLIDALALLPNAQLALIGSGPDRKNLLTRAKTQGVLDRLILTGSLPHVALAQWLMAADVMALPSCSEGLANAWLEALACGTPIVITDAGGAAEVLGHSAAGQIVSPEPNEIARAITHYIQTPCSPEECRAVSARFNWTENAQIWRDHLLLLARK